MLQPHLERQHARAAAGERREAAVDERCDCLDEQLFVDIGSPERKVEGA